MVASATFSLSAIASDAGQAATGSARNILRTRAANASGLRYLTMKLPGASRRKDLIDAAVWITGRSRKSGDRSTQDTGWPNAMSSQNIRRYSCSAGGAGHRKRAAISGMRRPTSQQTRPYTMMNHVAYVNMAGSGVPRRCMKVRRTRCASASTCTARSSSTSRMNPVARCSACRPVRAVNAACVIATKLPLRMGCESWPKNSSSSACAMPFHSAPYCADETRPRGEASICGAIPAAAMSGGASSPRARARARASATRLMEMVPFSSFFIVVAKGPRAGCGLPSPRRDRRATGSHGKSAHTD